MNPPILHTLNPSHPPAPASQPSSVFISPFYSPFQFLHFPGEKVLIAWQLFKGLHLRLATAFERRVHLLVCCRSDARRCRFLRFPDVADVVATSQVSRTRGLVKLRDAEAVAFNSAFAALLYGSSIRLSTEQLSLLSTWKRRTTSAALVEQIREFYPHTT